MTLNEYILLDGSRLGHAIYIARELNKNNLPLYKGGQEEAVADLGPFVFTATDEESFNDWYKQYGWGNAWGMVVRTHAGFEACWIHFRQFLLVKTEDGKELYFRFYDPRVLKVFLPTCDAKQLLDFFGPVDKFIVEGDSQEEAIEYWHQQGVLKQKTVRADKLFISHAKGLLHTTA